LQWKKKTKKDRRRNSFFFFTNFLLSFRFLWRQCHFQNWQRWSNDRQIDTSAMGKGFFFFFLNGSCGIM
jgi:hypothetical protein